MFGGLGSVLSTPTAVQVLAELQETPCSKEASALAAFGEGWIVHAAPFHASMRVKALFDDVPGLPPFEV